MKKFFKIFFLTIGIIIVLVITLFLVDSKLDKDAVEEKNFYSSTYDASKPALLPSLFINGERFFIKMPTAKGDTVLAFGDSGGGISMAFPKTIDKLGLRSGVKTGLIKGIMPMKYILFSDLVSYRNIPQPQPMRNLNIRRPIARVDEPFFMIPPMDDELRFISETINLDIFLGQNFFMGKAWTIDYPNRQIWVNTPLPQSEAGKPGVQQLGFKKNSNHEKIFGHPSMYIEVNGEIIEVLFDTGASIILSKNGKKAFNTQEKTIGGSFIAASIFDKWRKEHPEWKYYEKADMSNDIIEVPVVKIGGYEVGPVLFARRKDENWSKGMIGSMDKVVRGAIGGSALKYLKVNIDYNSELIKFEKQM